MEQRTTALKAQGRWISRGARMQRFQPVAGEQPLPLAGPFLGLLAPRPGMRLVIGLEKPRGIDFRVDLRG